MFSTVPVSSVDERELPLFWSCNFIGSIGDGPPFRCLVLLKKAEGSPRALREDPSTGLWNGWERDLGEVRAKWLRNKRKLFEKSRDREPRRLAVYSEQPTT